MENFDSDVISNGRKKVYTATESLELILPNSKSDGILEEGDLIYVVEKPTIEGKDYFRFRVMKFADSENESKVYTAENQYFKPYFENKSNVNTKAEAENKKENKKSKYVVPALTSVGGGVIFYFISKKFQKSIVNYTVAGLVLGAAVGYFLLKNKEKQDENKSNK